MHYTFIRSTTNYLRALAILQVLTGGIAVIPIAWIASWHTWLGLGHLPNDALLRYGIRGGAFVQACIGVLLWIIATDVVRYYPLVIAAGIIYIISGPAFYFIDSNVGMPHFWCIFDAVSCFLVGAVLLTLCLLSQNQKPDSFSS